MLRDRSGKGEKNCFLRCFSPRPCPYRVRRVLVGQNPYFMVNALYMHLDAIAHQGEMN
jgi:hypothetical protein